MDCIQEVNSLLENLGAAIGAGDLRLGSDGVCSAGIEGFGFSFFLRKEPPALFTQARLGKIGPKGLERLLRLDYMWDGTGGGVFGLNPDDGEVYLTHRLDFPLPDEPYPEFLCDVVEQLVGALEAADEGEEESAPAAVPAAGGGSGLRV